MKILLSFLLALASPAVYSQETRYQNPADGSTYTAPNGWKTYTSKSGIKAPNPKFALDGIRLLQAQDEIAARTTAEKLAAFIESARAAGDDIFVGHEEPANLLVQFRSVPGSHTVDVSYQGKINQALLKAYYDKLVSLRALETSGEVLFQFGIKIAP